MYLHELGHYLDLKPRKNIRIEKDGFVYSKKYEKKAWIIAMKLASEYKLNFDISYAIDILKSYDATSSILNNELKKKQNTA
jgi:hypothetical protein